MKKVFWAVLMTVLIIDVFSRIRKEDSCVERVRNLFSTLRRSPYGTELGYRRQGGIEAPAAAQFFQEAIVVKYPDGRERAFPIGECR